MKKIFWLCLGSLICVMPLLKAEVYTIDSMAEIPQYFQGAGENTLAVFDIDETLTLSSSPAFQRPNFSKSGSKIKNILASFSMEQKNIFLNLMIVSYPATLVEKKTPLILRQLQKKQIKTIALTASLSGKIDALPDFKSFRNQELKKLGIDFSDAFPELPPITLDEVPANFSYNPAFKNGILFANGLEVDKGEVLSSFLRKIEWVPEQVIFIDDKMNNVLAVHQAMEQMDIPCVCLHYKGAQFYQSKPIQEELLVKEWVQLANKALSYWDDYTALTGDNS